MFPVKLLSKAAQLKLRVSLYVLIETFLENLLIHNKSFSLWEHNAIASEEHFVPSPCFGGATRSWFKLFEFIHSFARNSSFFPGFWRSEDFYLHLVYLKLNLQSPWRISGPTSKQKMMKCTEIKIPIFLSWCNLFLCNRKQRKKKFFLH